MQLPAALGGPLVVSLPTVLVQQVRAYSLQRQTENLCVKFSSSHMKKEKRNRSGQTDVTNGRTISLPISMCNRWQSSCWPHNPCDNYNQPQLVVLFMTELSFCWCPSTVSPPSRPWSILKCHPISVSISSALRPVTWPSYLAWQSFNS